MSDALHPEPGVNDGPMLRPDTPIPSLSPATPTVARDFSQQAAMAAIARHFWTWASPGTLLYLASAASALIGVAQMIGPITDDAPLMPRLMPVLVLNCYELLLFGAALLIVLWKRVLDDAVSLVVLVTLFMVASATSLDVAAPRFFEAAGWFGLAGALAAAGKLAAMSRYLVGSWRGGRIVALAILVLWNFTLPALIGFRLAIADRREAIDVALRYWWLIGSWGLVAAAVTQLAAQARSAPTLSRGPEAPPFLRSDAMRWMLVALILAGSFVHQYALAWVFGLGMRIGDLLLGAAVIVPVVIELRRLTGRRVGAWDAMLVAVLALAFVVALASRRFTVAADWHALNHPPMAALLAGAALTAIALRPGRRSLAIGGGVMAAMGLVTFNWPAQPMLAWLPSGMGAVVLAVVLLGLGVAASLSKPAARVPA